MDETLKPCPFCGGEADYHSEKGPTGEVYGWVGCNQCDAMSCHTDTRSMQPEETHPIDAWNTRADAAPTPKADEVEAVARALAKANRIEICDSAQYAYSSFREPALAAIAALAAARGDPVARVVEWLRKENYRAFTDGMEAAAQICGSLAEVEYDDADGFDAATGCEAAIMRVVKDQRREQAALGASHDAEA